MRSSIKPSVRQAAATIGQPMVIQFMAQYRLPWLRDERGASPRAERMRFYASNRHVNGLQTSAGTLGAPTLGSLLTKARQPITAQGAGRCDDSANRVEKLAPGVRLLKEARATACHRLLAHPGIVVSGDEENRRRDALGRKLIPQIEPRHPGQLNVEDEAIELRLFHIRAEFFGG